MIKAILSILFMGVFMTIGVFSYLFIMNTNYMVVDEIDNAITNNTGEVLTAEIITAVHNEKQKFKQFSAPIDILLILMYFSVAMFAIAAAFFAPPLSKFNFLTFLTMGSYFILLLMNYIKQVHDFLRDNLLTNVFSAAETSLPFYNWLMSNYAVVSIFIVTVILLVNQFSTIKDSLRDDLEEVVRDE